MVSGPNRPGELLAQVARERRQRVPLLWSEVGPGKGLSHVASRVSIAPASRSTRCSVSSRARSNDAAGGYGMAKRRPLRFQCGVGSILIRS
jgi:hypothetical protein